MADEEKKEEKLIEVKSSEVTILPASLDLSDKGLERLLEKALDHVESDVEEAQKHVDAITTRINDPSKKSALEIYSLMYQEALKVKGIARDRHLKIIKMIQDRLRVKEVLSTSQKAFAWTMTPEAIQQILDQKKENEGKDE